MIYNLIIIIITRIWISIRYGFFKMSKVNHLTMFLPLVVLYMGSQCKHEKTHWNQTFVCPSSLYKQKLRMVKEFGHVQQKKEEEEDNISPNHHWFFF